MSRNSKRHYLTLAVIPILFSAVFCRAEDPRRDGNWWIDLDSSSKVMFVVGFFDGMQLGKDFSVWENLKSKDECAGKSIQSFETYAKLLDSVTSGQLRDGLDSFLSGLQKQTHSNIPLLFGW